MKQEYSCGAIVFKIINDELNVLLVEQTLNHWGFPKGHMEKNETKQQTAIREVKEETNIDIKLIDGFEEMNTYSPLPKTMKDVTYFVAYPTSFELIKQDSEIKVVSWYPIKKSSRLNYLWIKQRNFR
ncbi:bis(5'-nucleosyl)-tetraphosphatase [Mycoplasma struthionis]|uniref:bis(5'-nucleosyl)-tetraphosphatase n=1 Tax=Mycoplasma struthionis TaxID=538220 RepID=UPI0021BD2C73|nr:NUDIX domain-containing protein [Mycoplasma struthionis]